MREKRKRYLKSSRHLINNTVLFIQEDWTYSLTHGINYMSNPRQLKTLKSLGCHCRTNSFSVGKLPRAALPNTYNSSQLQNESSGTTTFRVKHQAVSKIIQQRITQHIKRMECTTILKKTCLEITSFTASKHLKDLFCLT